MDAERRAEKRYHEDMDKGSLRRNYKKGGMKKSPAKKK